MKKTMIALVALSGLAMADSTTSYDLLSTTTNWTIGSARGHGEKLAIDTEYRQIGNNGGNWSQSWAQYTFDTPLALTDKGDTVDFSYVLGTNGTHDDAAVVTLVDTAADKVVTIGMGRYSAGAGAIQYGVGPVMSLSAEKEIYTLETITPLGTVGTIGLNDIKGISGSITMGDSGAIASFGEGMTVNLGDSFTVDKVVITMDGWNNDQFPTIAFLNVTHTDVTPVPEPATATLSLLALAGLCARRRRH